jgi:hypothetical protein
MNFGEITVRGYYLLFIQYLYSLYSPDKNAHLKV